MIVFVTGASSGFGAAIARKFARQGHRVIAAARRKDRLDALAQEFGGTSVLPVEMDVTDKASIDEALATLPHDWKEIDVLVNNAGLALGMELAQEASLEYWETMIDTNCKGLVTITRRILPDMVARGRGTVINIGSMAGAYPYPGGNVYGATKAFVDQFSHNLCADLVGTGVRATNIAPGLAGGTEFSNVRLKDDAGLPGNRATQSRRYRGCGLLGCYPARAYHDQLSGNDAKLPGLWPIINKKKTISEHIR
jgi:3-hydroxy acid dehydrogenase/malonic semialdehyde reductase